MTYEVGFDLLAEQFRLTMIDPPGWGESPSDQKSAPIPELAHTTAAWATAIGIERFHLAGGSIGGIHALWLAAQYPERVKSLSLFASMAFRKDHWAMPGFDVVAFVRAAEQGADISAMTPPPDPMKPWATLEVRQELQRRILRVMEFTGPEFDEDLAERVSKLDIPCLALFGADDAVPFPSVAEVYRRLIPGCQAIVLENAGHDLPGGAPDRYAALVTDFIKGLD
jgi:pimeloyl-ACP methyl ester carboxylesterase